jgi:hypothetical protein
LSENRDWFRAGKRKEIGAGLKRKDNEPGITKNCGKHCSR